MQNICPLTSLTPLNFSNSPKQKESGLSTALRRIAFAMVFVPTLAFATTKVVKVNKQQSFGSAIPAGDYSGITPIGNDRYAVVSDKSAEDGYFVFHIDIDSLSGTIVSVRNEGFRSAGTPNRDQEGIAFVPERNTVFISGEADNRIREYEIGDSGRHTGRELQVPDVFKTATANYGFESITYNAATHRFWTTTESTLPQDGQQATATNGVSNRLRLQSFNDSLQPTEQYFYEMDAPTANRAAANYALGVSELLAEDDGSLLVLEREFYVSPKKLGSFVNCKIYEVSPNASLAGTLLPKTLLTEFRTKLTLTSFALANYEGMCFAPPLANGNRILLLVSDSQSRYAGVLKDWFKTIVLSPL